MSDVREDNERQAPPFCVQIELTEGCNLRCSFCGLNGIRGKDNDFKFMTQDTARTLCRRMRETGDWRPRIEFAMHGEPTAHPELVEMIQLFREELPRECHMMMTSNGYGLIKTPTETIDALLHSLNVLALDWYENVKLVPKILATYRGRHKPKRYPADADANPHRRRKPDEHDLVIVQDIQKAEKGTHASINNHCGSGAPKNDHGQGRRCAKPFREMSVRYDGNVAICCNDWRGEYRIGNVVRMPLEQLWNGPAMRAARRKLYHGERDFGPCEGCDALSYRPGLLPDQRGKGTLPRPTELDGRVIASALGRGPLTLPVLRPWELADVVERVE